MYKILITSSNKYDTLKEIALNLTNSKLSPCSYIVKDVESFYLWDKKTVSESECLLIVKCLDRNIQDIKKVIYDSHNYDLPEIISHEFNIVSDKYKKWFDEISEGRL